MAALLDWLCVQIAKLGEWLIKKAQARKKKYIDDEDLFEWLFRPYKIVISAVSYLITRFIHGIQPRFHEVECRPYIFEGLTKAIVKKEDWIATQIGKSAEREIWTPEGLLPEAFEATALPD